MYLLGVFFGLVFFGQPQMAYAKRPVAFEINCDFERMFIESNNRQTLEKHQAEVAAFERDFESRKPGYIAQANVLYPSWAQIAHHFTDKTLNAKDHDGLQAFSRGQIEGKLFNSGLNDRLAELEQELSDEFAKKGSKREVTVKALKINRNDNVYYNMTGDGEVQFEICLDDRNIAQGKGWVCDSVTRNPESVPNQEQFVQDYLAFSKRNLASFNSVQLKKPALKKVAEVCRAGEKKATVQNNLEEGNVSKSQIGPARAPAVIKNPEQVPVI